MFSPLSMLLFALCSRAEAQDSLGAYQTKLVLDPQVFTQAGVKEEADAISKKVDQLIPGAPLDSGGAPLFVSALPTCPLEGGYPVTVEGDRQFAEMPDAGKYSARIYLCGVTVANTIYGQRFAFQLGHELAHVKTGASVDNYLEETFAVAVSFEVLKSLKSFTYLNDILREATVSVPPLRALLGGATQADVDFAAFYWQLSIARLKKPDPKTKRWDYQAMALAVLVMQSGAADQIRWPLLLGLSHLNEGPPLSGQTEALVKSPDLKQLTTRIPALCRLGYVCK